MLSVPCLDMEDKICQLIKKYDFEIERETVYLSVIRDLLRDELKESKRTGVICAGRYTEHLLTDFGDVIDCFCIMDNDIQKQGKEINGFYISGIDNIGLLDKVIVGTYDYREEVTNQLLEMGVAREDIIDIPTLLNKAGIVSWNCYYLQTEDAYIPFIMLKNLYDHSNCRDSQEKYLKLRIKLYLQIRDIPSAQMCLKEYISNEFEEIQKMRAAFEELDLLLKDIKDAFYSRKQRDIVWFWQDALSFRIAQKMGYYKELQSKSLFFTNAYSSSMWTRHVYDIIFEKKYEINDEGENETSELLDDLESAGYDCVRFVANTKEGIVPMRQYDYIKEALIDYKISTTEIYWHCLNYVLNSTKPVFILAHSVLETHPPICCPELQVYNRNWALYRDRFTETTRKKLDLNEEICANYLDRITRFFSEILNSNAVKIYMSDHGFPYYKESRRWTKDSTHIHFLVTGSLIEEDVCQELVSLYSFDKLIKYILNPSKCNRDEIISQYIKMRSVSIYNKELCAQLKEIGNEEYTISFRGIQSKEDRFILLENGKEIYNVFPDDYTNHIDNTKYKERIQVLRELAGNSFVSC